MNTAKPTINLVPRKGDRIVEMIAVLSLLLLWVYSVYLFTQSPEIIPAHYNMKGEADRYGNRFLLFILAGIATVIYIGFSYLQRVPHIYNYPVKITGQNAEQEYRRAVTLIRILKISICLSFLLIADTLGQAKASMELWRIPLVLMLILVPLLFYLSKAFYGRK